MSRPITPPRSSLSGFVIRWGLIVGIAYVSLMSGLWVLNSLRDTYPGWRGYTVGVPAMIVTYYSAWRLRNVWLRKLR